MILPNLFPKEGDWENSDDKNLFLSKDKMFMQQRHLVLVLFFFAFYGISNDLRYRGAVTVLRALHCR